jgi:dTDP-4-amino-4,6-dideoxygalactose transaminase
MIAAVAARRQNAAAATRNVTANGNNKKSVSFKTIENQTQRIGENSTMTKIAAAAKRRQLFSTANGHKNTTDDEGKIVESSVAANPPSHINIGENSKMTKIAAAAKRRQLSSTANGHKNTTDNEGKIVKSSIAANPPSHINIERIHGGDPPSNVNYHTAITADNKRGTSSKSKGSRT